MAGGMSFHCHRNNLFLTGLKATVLIFMYNLSGVSTERVIVDPHITAILGKKIELMCVVHVQEALTQISWEKVHNGSTQTLAVFNPTYGISIPDEYQDKLSFKTPSENDATLVLEEVSFTDAGEYTCKVVTFPYGNTQASTTVTVMVEPKISVSRGSDPLMDGGNETVVAVCTAENGKPAAEITWVSEVFGEPVQTLIDEPNDCVTVENRYNWKPTRFAQGKQLTCVIRHPALESEIRIPFTLDVLHAPEVAITGYDDNWFVGRENVQLKCNAAANPGATQYSWSRLNGELPAGLRIANNTLIFGRPLDHNDSGTYQCEVTNDIGSRTNTRNIYILDPPPTTTTLPTTPLPHTTAGITSLAATKRALFTSPTLESLHEGPLGTIIGGAVGGALFLILLIILVGVCYMKKRRTFRGDYYTKQYTGPSDMQKESPLDVLQPHELQQYNDPNNGSLKQKTNEVIYPDYSKDVKNNEWGNVENMNRCTEGDTLPVDYYEDRVPVGTKYAQDDYYEGNDGDFVSHLDGSVISRREWYV
ncbi:nectin-3-like isoform X1 [Polyodon spathula]|uniref:nectin-3-like isoform X1 n=1 Tax=Polyodon spathula TaxID=7913 RepID=UPI001B7E2259|nr:nectin-3-like isoform X1 [Polyodon spathula]